MNSLLSKSLIACLFSQAVLALPPLMAQAKPSLSGAVGALTLSHDFEESPGPKPGAAVPPRIESKTGAQGTAGGENALTDGCAVAVCKRVVLHHP